MKNNLLSIILFFFVLNTIKAQTHSPDTSIRPFQVSLVFPLGTNFTNTKVVNNFSLNILQGMSTGVKGVEIGGLLNIEKNFVSGVQIGGIGNFVRDSVHGVQLSGIINKSGNVKGVQIGLINICDSIKGIPFGLVSFVRSGYSSWETWLAEALYVNTAYKIGVKHFYNIYALGLQPFGQELKLAPGFGFGSEIDLSKKSFINIDLIAFQIGEDEVWTDELNLLNQLRILVGKRNIEYDLYFGPTVNLLVSRFFNDYTWKLGSEIAPYSIYSKTGNEKIQLWIGLNIGIKIHPVRDLSDYYD